MTPQRATVPRVAEGGPRPKAAGAAEGPTETVGGFDTLRHFRHLRDPLYTFRPISAIAKHIKVSCRHDTFVTRSDTFVDPSWTRTAPWPSLHGIS